MNARVLNPHIQVGVQLLHGLPNQEVSNLFRNSVSNITHDNRIIIINSSAQLHNKSFLLIHFGLWFRRLVWRLVLSWLLLVRNSLGFSLCLTYNTGTKFFIVEVVREEVGLFCINNRFNKFFCVLAQLLQNLDNVVHHDGSKCWEA